MAYQIQIYRSKNRIQSRDVVDVQVIGAALCPNVDSVRERSDRAIFHTSRRSLFPDATLLTFAILSSDHPPIHAFKVENQWYA